ncbi:DUF1573 domain-containing protein [bacterium SCSIO 12741]|nr:DUF1573 domain-containing protein [bacterium SCSIO 12741]
MKPLLFTLTFLLGVSVTQAQVEKESVDPGPTTTIQFDETTYDFGEVPQGESVTHVFTFTNTGSVPLVIASAKGSCGCTVPFYPKVPIVPGESSEIEVVFDTRGKMGLQFKKVYLIANTEPSTTDLLVKGKILKSDYQEEGIRGIGPEEQRKRREKESIEEVKPNCFIIYPNPTSDQLQLELKEHIGESATVLIYNRVGELVLEQKIERISRSSTVFDVSEYPPGVYSVTIQLTNNELYTQCFMVTASK